MNPLSAAKDLARAITFPFKFLLVVGLCAFINRFTTPGHGWFQWVAFGMGIALICVWARALKILVATVGFAGIGTFFYRWWKSRSDRDSASAGNAGTMTLHS